MYPELSPDNRWIAFFIFKSADTFQIFVAPLRGSEEISRSAWIPISGDKARNVAPTWSPDGNLLYFDAVGTEDRMFAQPLDRETRRPVGAPIPVPIDFGPRQFLRNWSESVLQLSRDRMVFPAEQDTSNIWLMDLPARR
jgi:Tol biopolymer transport system component